MMMILGLCAYLTNTTNEMLSLSVASKGELQVSIYAGSYGEYEASKLLPGQTIKEPIRLKNLGNIPAYVFVKVEISEDIFSTTLNENFHYMENEKVYCYGTEENLSSFRLENGEKSLFDSITINPNLQPQETQEPYTIPVVGYFIQSDYLNPGSAKPKEIWRILASQTQQ